MRPVGEIEILDFIGADFWGDGVTAKSITAAIRGMGDVRRIQVTINSAGGDVFEGLAIYNALKESGKPIDVRVSGLAASSASMIAMAGDTITMLEGALMMVHRASGAAYGNAETMMDLAATLEKVDGEMAGIYARRSGMDEARCLAMMSDETWLNGEEAVAAGLATERKGKRDEGALKAAAVMLANPRIKGLFSKTPDSLLALRPAAMANTPKQEGPVMEPKDNQEKAPETPETPAAPAAPAVEVKASIEQINTAKAEGAKSADERSLAILGMAKEYGFEAEAAELIKSGKSVADVRADLQDKRIKALEAAKTPGDAPAGPDTAGDADVVKAFEGAVDERVKAGMSKADAIRATVKEDAKRHAAYLAAKNRKAA